MNTPQTFTASRNGHVYVDRGTWSQVERVLEQGYCVSGRRGPDQHGVVELTLQEPIAAVPFAESSIMGYLVLVDTASHKNSGAALVLSAL